MRPSSGRILVSLALVWALLLVVVPRLSKRRRAQAAPARTRRLTDEKANSTAIGRIATAVAAVAVALAVMGGSLAAALGALGDEQPLSGRVPVAAVGGGGGAGPASAAIQMTPPASALVETPVPAAAETESSPADVAVGGDRPMGPLPPSTAPGMPENVNASSQFLALKDTLAEEIAAYGAQVGGIDVAIAVTDLQTGERISINGNMPHRTGCTINMFALLAVVGEFQAGRADPQSVGYNIRVGIGGSYPPQVRRFLEMVFPSYQAGVDRAQELMSSWGMVASHFYQVPYYQIGTQINQLTALEANLVLGKLYRGELFDPEWTAYTLARLREVNWGLNYILPGQLPAAATVAHKIGFYADWDGWVNNDAGIVTFTGGDGEAKAYVVTYLSQKARTEYTGYSFGARLSRIVWDWFEATYRLGMEPAPPPPPPPLSAPMPAPTPTPTPVAEPTPIATPEPEPTPSPTAMPEPTPSPTPEPTPSPTPSPTPEPSPSPTPEPSPTPTP